ncbi:MAG: hypothetical protein OJF58_000930 [Enhydrobacter sp.]|nr:MAG: hypothetical protein OJF58_000930 [Enhydrobacter sp.]
MPRCRRAGTLSAREGAPRQVDAQCDIATPYRFVGHGRGARDPGLRPEFP